MTRVVFMGSAEFSVPSLLALQMATEVVGVVTQPDRRAGRGQRLSANPVKRIAAAAEIPVYQPDSLRSPEAVAELSAWKPDVIVVAAYGQILRREILYLPEHGCLNVHASLLPRWRGAAPIPAAILSGDEVTGVTIMKMDAGLDTGPILAQQGTALETDDSTATLSPRLAEMGAQLLIECLPLYLEGELTSRLQPDEGVTHAPPLVKSDGLIDWNRPVEEIDRQVRALNPWPTAYTLWRGRQVTVWELIPFPDWSGPEPPGVVFSGEVAPMVSTGQGAAWLIRLQLAGKTAMASDAFLRGQPDFVGSMLGEGT